MEFSTIFNEALCALLVAVAGILVTFIVNLIKKGVNYLNERIDLIKDDKFKKYCKDLMQAAETMKDELLNGSQKKKWVTDKLVAYANEKKIPVTEEQISNLIQSIFLELDGITLNKYKNVTEVDLEKVISDTVDKVLTTAVTTSTTEKIANNKKK